jgi:dihydrolipoamide dehydrogenase
MQEWKEGIVKKLTGGVTSLVKGSGGTITIGNATITGPNSVEVTSADGKKESYTASKGIIVATGTQMIEIPGFEPDHDVVITAREAVSLQSAPESMVLIGGGVIGLELGMVYQKLGTKITVVEMMDQLLPGTDPDLVRVVQKRLKKDGAEIHLKSKAVKLDKSGGKAKVTIETDGKQQVVEAEKVLVAVGFKPNSAGIGLEGAGVKLDARGHIAIDDEMRTNVPSIFAIGDVAGMPYLAHKASKEGEIAAEVIAGHKSARDYRGMPAAIFTDPEIATVGLTEDEAKEAGHNVKTGSFPFAANGKALSANAPQGFVKFVADADDDTLLGVHIVGHDASNLISEAALGIEMGATVADIGLTVHPHPTLGETLMEAAHVVEGHAIHIFQPKG